MDHGAGRRPPLPDLKQRPPIPYCPCTTAAAVKNFRRMQNMTMTHTPQVLTNPPAELRTGRRWIRRRVEALDPQQDYTEIVKLTTLFHVNDFIADWAFTHIMCRATTGHSANAINREGTGKLVSKADLRFDDTTH